MGPQKPEKPGYKRRPSGSRKGLRVEGLEVRVEGLEVRVEGLEVRVEGLEVRVGLVQCWGGLA